MVIPVWDRTLATLISCVDQTLRRIGGAPTYVLTDNEKTVTEVRLTECNTWAVKLPATGQVCLSVWSRR